MKLSAQRLKPELKKKPTRQSHWSKPPHLVLIDTPYSDDGVPPCGEEPVECWVQLQGINSIAIVLLHFISNNIGNLADINKSQAMVRCSLLVASSNSKLTVSVFILLHGDYRAPRTQLRISRTAAAPGYLPSLLSACICLIHSTNLQPPVPLRRTVGQEKEETWEEKAAPNPSWFAYRWLTDARTRPVVPF